MVHIAIILDGNRRYARKSNFLQKLGHVEGVKTVEKLLHWCDEIGGIEELTLYVFSLENFNRSKDEVKFLETLFIKKIQDFSKSNKTDRIKFHFIGRKHLFTKKIQDLMYELEEKSKHNVGLILNIAMGYSGRAEIVDACNLAIEKGIQLSDSDFSKYLYLNSDPDILIRTGGDKRVSNFLLWQLSYTELFFIDKLWPEFTKEDLQRIINEFNTRQRRFGK